MMLKHNTWTHIHFIFLFKLTKSLEIDKWMNKELMIRTNWILILVYCVMSRDVTSSVMTSIQFYVHTVQRHFIIRTGSTFFFTLVSLRYHFVIFLLPSSLSSSSFCSPIVWSFWLCLSGSMFYTFLFFFNILFCLSECFRPLDNLMYLLINVLDLFTTWCIYLSEWFWCTITSPNCCSWPAACNDSATDPIDCGLSVSIDSSDVLLPPRCSTP